MYSIVGCVCMLLIFGAMAAAEAAAVLFLNYPFPCLRPGPSMQGGCD